MSFRARFWTTLIGWTVAVGGAAFVFRKWVDTTVTDALIGGALAVVGSIVALVAWRCPKCGAGLGSFTPSKTCRKCGAEHAL